MELAKLVWASTITVLPVAHAMLNPKALDRRPKPGSAATARGLQIAVGRPQNVLPQFEMAGN
jgi:hypothetical protein